jgi:electron transfer flavoprotein beta subunit
MLNIVVCVKAVPDPKEACNIKIDPATKTLLRCDVPMVVNSLDKNAIEVALQLKEKTDVRITILSMGPPEAGNIVKECLALGADRGILLSDPAFGGADTVILCGMASSDGSTEWVGPQIATFLKLPVVTMVKEIVETDVPWWKVKASIDDGYRLMQVKLPAVFTVTREVNTPRALSFSGIIKARKKEIEQWGIDNLGVSPESVGLKGSPTIVSELNTTESKRKVEFIKGTREEKAELLVHKLIGTGLL